MAEETSPPTDAPDVDMTGPESDDPTDREPRRAPAFAPVTLLLVTVVALAAAGLAAWLVIHSAAEEPVDVRDALQKVEDSSPLVPRGVQPAGVGDMAPDVRLEFLDGGVQQLSELRGVPLVLNFWSSTCAPCLSEMPAIETVHRDLGDAARVVGIDVTDTSKAGTEMVQRTGVTYRNARDPHGEISTAFGGTALPRTVLVGADGRILAVHTGALDEAGLTGLLRDNGMLPA